MATPKRLALKSVRQSQATLEAVEAQAAQMADLTAAVNSLADKVNVLIAILTNEDRPPKPSPRAKK